MKRDYALWIGMLAGPAIWLLCFYAQWSLSGWVCAFQWKPVLYAISIISLALAAGAGMLSWREWQNVGAEMPGEAGGAIPRARLMAIFGIALSALSMVLIIATAIPNVLLGACA